MLSARLPGGKPHRLRPYPVKPPRMKPHPVLLRPVEPRQPEPRRPTARRRTRRPRKSLRHNGAGLGSAVQCRVFALVLPVTRRRAWGIQFLGIAPARPDGAGDRGGSPGVTHAGHGPDAARWPFALAL